MLATCNMWASYNMIGVIPTSLMGLVGRVCVPRAVEVALSLSDSALNVFTVVSVMSLLSFFCDASRSAGKQECRP
jgi:hypothetical protein